MAFSKKTIIIAAVLIVAAGAIFVTSYSLLYRAKKSALANPASVNCEKKGGRVEIRTDANGGQVGICVFANKSECEEWAFMRGECDPGNIGINFIKAGTIMNSPEKADTGAWYFQYEEDGTSLATSKLSFGQDSICMSGRKQFKCDTANIKTDERVSVEGLKTDGTILVRRLREL